MLKLSVLSSMYTLTLFSLHTLLLITLSYLSYVDWQTRRIPDKATLILLALAILWIYLKQQSFEQHLLIGGLGFTLFFVLRKIFTSMKGTVALGWGDVKLFSVLCVFLSPGQFATFCICSGALGLLTSIFWKKEPPFPFAPAISLAFLITFWLKFPF